VRYPETPTSSCRPRPRPDVRKDVPSSLGMDLSGRTRLLGVIGHPVGHTLSPRMHNAAFAASGLDYVYLPIDVRPEDLPAAVSGLRALGFRGFNVNMPHKEAILPLLDELYKAARAAGAVNTVTIEGRGMRGLNTDGSGFVEAYERSGLTFAGGGCSWSGPGAPPLPSP